jgi:imidazolonepropionase-like amidohydrolase
MGPGRPVPPFPAMGWIDLPPDHLVASKQLLSCNYAQAMEGDFDPSHISFLHGSLAAFCQFEELVGSGLTPMQVIVAGTSRAAELLGLAGRIGAVKPGCFADLLVVRGDPVSTITSTRSVALVIKSGRIVWHDAAHEL